MSSLTDKDKRYFENLLDMNGGYVLDYTDSTFAAFFNQHGIDIHGLKYKNEGTSKAKKMRSFWEQEDNTLVGNVLSDMLDSYETYCKLNTIDINKSILKECRNIIARLIGKSVPEKSAQTIDDFLNSEFSIPNISKLPIDIGVAPIIEGRLNEARAALGAGAHLSVIFLCGSTLEAVLIGAALRNPEQFNQATASPKDKDNKVRKFQEWRLADFINVACEVRLLKPDVKKFSNGLRDFRNYIHPYEQMASGFAPDEHTAKICFQVLKAALASIGGERGCNSSDLI